ncbi:hypothetical protein [Marinospirillum perlucidum]|uniref:hypothetical protein n=1 Tax=Marinospirillum perlucidum TaxID=1982602 RepID=UPI00138FC16B|nr:hypothetical protein [Marinospirillum perlucidum]
MQASTFKSLGMTLALSLLSAPVLANSSTLTGVWACTQELSPEPDVQIRVTYQQEFLSSAQFTINGRLEAAFPQNQLVYSFDGGGNWSLEGERLTINTTNSQFAPANATALQLDEAGVLKADQFNHVQSQDHFDVLEMTQDTLALRHQQEGFTTRCQR